MIKDTKGKGKSSGKGKGPQDKLDIVEVGLIALVLSLFFVLDAEFR